MNRIKIAIIIAIIGSVTWGCASSRSGKVYSRDQARVQHTVQKGTVEKVAPVEIEGTKSPVGAVAGGALGAVVGSSIGDDSGKRIATVLGAIIGGAAGSAAEEKITRKKGVEITVKLDNGETIAIVQEADETFQVGTRVRILTDPNGTVRVRAE